MEVQPLVSIIIPTYNRAHLIGETLDSIVEQTYNNWECIVIDDGSIDNTDEVLGKYCENDNRIKYSYRPNKYLPGGNGARNYGLFKAEGIYIIFFDSDDLMTLDHIYTKIEKIRELDLDYIISKTKYLDDNDISMENFYNFDDYKITAQNYILQKINWVTLDVCIKASLAKSITFNEKLKSGQEYNYYCKLVLKSTKASFVNKYISLRRKHEDSKQAKLKLNRSLKRTSSFKSKWETYQEIYINLDKTTKRSLLYGFINYFYLEKKLWPKKNLFFLQQLNENFSKGAFYFIIMVLSELFLNRGFRFREKLKNQLSNNHA